MVDKNQLGGDLYSQFASLLSRPNEDIKELAQGCLDAVLGHPEYPSEAAKELRAFISGIAELDLDDLQGYYSYTFELSADTTMDMGYHLFDGFKRTNTLVALKEMFKANSFPYDAVAKGELADNLVVLLKFLGGLEDQGLKTEFRESFLIKSLEKMAKNFDGAKSKHIEVYGHVVKALISVIGTDVKAAI